MADTRLPLKTRTAIRDWWDKEDAPVNKAREALHKTLGHKPRIQPEWALLNNELEKAYGDREDLVRAVAGCVELWCKMLEELLDGADDADGMQQKWAETLLERVSPGTSLRLHIDVGAEASTSWSEERGAFVLTLPKRAVAVPTEFAAAYQAGLLHCFDEKQAKDLAHRGTAIGGRSAGADDWADVDVDRSTGKVAVVDHATAAAKSVYLPSADSLPRPDELLLRPPYHLIVSSYGQSDIEISGSHTPSLRLLSDYLKRWSRVNHNNVNVPAAVEIDLRPSCFGTGVVYDRVSLSTEKARNEKLFSLNPTIVLAFVEGVLGYDRVSVYGNVWTYRRDVEFKE